MTRRPRRKLLYITSLGQKAAALATILAMASVTLHPLHASTAERFDPRVPLPTTSLEWTITSLFAKEPSGHGKASIKLDSQTTRFLKQGDVITDGVTLIAVTSAYVVIDNQGNHQRLYLRHAQGQHGPSLKANLSGTKTSHEASIVALPPSKQSLTNRQIRSRFSQLIETAGARADRE